MFYHSGLRICGIRIGSGRRLYEKKMEELSVPYDAVPGTCGLRRSGNGGKYGTDTGYGYRDRIAYKAGDRDGSGEYVGNV